MKITIITVVFNSHQTIKDAITSVLGQTHKNIEYIVIDGGSTDGTVDIVRSFSNKISKFITEPDKGIYDAMNKGIALATGDVVGILNSDDFYANDRVLETVAKALQDPAVDCCYGDLVYVNRENTKVVRHWQSCEYKEGLFERGWMPAHPTFFVKRSAYEKYGVFDLSIPIATDHEMLFRLMHQHKLRSRYIPQVLVRMRLGGTSNKNFRNVLRQNMAILKTLNKNGVKVSPAFFVVKICEKLKQFFPKANCQL